jgi:hypothetical protein
MSGPLVVVENFNKLIVMGQRAGVKPVARQTPSTASKPNAQANAAACAQHLVI